MEVAENRYVLSSRLDECGTDLPSLPFLGAHRVEELNESELVERVADVVGAEDEDCGCAGCHGPSWRGSYFREKSAWSGAP